MPPNDGGGWGSVFEAGERGIRLSRLTILQGSAVIHILAVSDIPVRVFGRETVSAMTMRRLSPWLGSLLLLAGCGESDDLKLVPVSGTITINGSPLEGATVAFIPAPDNAAGAPGLDTTGPNGNYKAMTRQRSGLAPGKYKMSVTMPLATNTAKNLPEDIQNDPMMAKMALGLDTKAPTSKGAAKPGAYEKDVEVPDESTVLDFDVKAKDEKAASK